MADHRIRFSHYVRCVLICFLATANFSNGLETRQSLAIKGKFFVHTLHSASFFTSTVPVKWTATLKNRPMLPVWLKLVHSRHSAIAYLIGTPVGRMRQLTVHVIAKRTDNFAISEQFVVITLQSDPKYLRSTQELVKLHVTNHDVEDFLSDRSGLLGRLEMSIRETFKGKNVNPYIEGLTPARELPSQTKLPLLHSSKLGTVVSVGSQRNFSANTHQLIEKMREDKGFCRKKNLASIDAHFSPTFNIDFCKTKIQKVTLVREFAEEEQEKEFKNQKVVDLVFPPGEDSRLANTEAAIVSQHGFSFWESLIIFPCIGGFFVICFIVLWCIFLGGREGQQWRDYKTPQTTLEEYASVREGQRKLRELSQQRQILLRAGDKADSVAPSDIHTFLQPKSVTHYSGSLKGSRTAINKSNSKLNDKAPAEILPSTDSLPIGKQTVAEAARQVGSSLHLYRNPIDVDLENEEGEADEQEKDSLDGVEMLHEH